MPLEKLSIIIPSYNEAATIGTVLERIMTVHPALNLMLEIIVVDDGSTDDTFQQVETFCLQHPHWPVVFLQHPHQQGKGAAIHTGLAQASGDFVLIQDADLEYDPADYAHLLRPILRGGADAVFGTRFIGGKPHRVLFFWHSLGNRFLTFLSNLFTNLNLTDMEAGYKLFRTAYVRKLRLCEKDFGFEPEITAKFSRLPGVKIFEVGISYYGRTYQEGKKINWKDGVKAIYCILKYNIWARE